jgi:hypothetical protein
MITAQPTLSRSIRQQTRPVFLIVLLFLLRPCACFCPDITSPLQNLALALSPSLGDHPRPDHIHVEPHATDSLQNLLFSILLFCTLTARPPIQITVIGHEFKRDRFLNLHCKALRIPLSRMRYVGIDPAKDANGRRQIEEGEAKAMREWMADMYGMGSNLGGKRAKRGWKGPDEVAGSYGGILGVRDLLAWTGGQTGAEVFAGRLAWSEDGGEQGRQTEALGVQNGTSRSSA